MSDAEQKPHIMSSLTDKGYFALDLIAQGISPTHKELDQLWKDANQRGKSTNQPESDHLQQAPEMIGELRDKLDEAIPEDLPSNIREMAIEEIEQFFNAHLQAAVRKAENRIAKSIDDLADGLSIPSLTTWKQGKFINFPKYDHMGERWKYEQQEYEQTLIRPDGGTNNALFQVASTVSASEITEYLEAVGELLQQLKQGEA